MDSVKVSRTANRKSNTSESQESDVKKQQMEQMKTLAKLNAMSVEIENSKQLFYNQLNNKIREDHLDDVNMNRNNMLLDSQNSDQLR